MFIKKIITSFFAYNIKDTKPRIIDLDQPIKIVGMAVDTDVKNIYRDVPRLGKRFVNYKKENEIPNKKHPWVFTAVSKDFDEDRQTFTYIIGDVVTSFADIPTGLITFEIPALTYAVFPIRPKNRLGWGIAIGAAKKFVYTNWLPNSGYQSAGLIDDFEYHNERSISKRNPEIDLYVAIKAKVPASSS